MNWQDVQQAVVNRYREVLPVAIELADIADSVPGVHTVWYNPQTKCAAALGNPLALPEFATVEGVNHVWSGAPDPTSDWVLCKTANGWFSAPAKMWGDAQRAIGGVSPVAAMVTGGLLGSGLGYAGGAFVGRNRPEHVRRALKRRWAMLGGMAGAVPGAAWGAMQYRPDPGKLGNTLQDRGAGWLSPWPFVDPPELPKDSPQPAIGAASTIAGNSENWPEKLAEFRSGADLGVPSIPVDAFNEIVWNDVKHPANPFGTKSQWGDNSQRLGTPPQVAATTSGLLAGAQAARGGAELVSPMDVAMAAAVGGGKGLIAGLVLGKTLAALAGLEPQTQSMLQRAGFWGGALTAAVQRAFG